MRKKYNIAFYGAGKIARKFVKAATENERIELYSVFSRDIEHAINFAEEFHVRYAFDSYEKMLHDDQIDVVYVSTPTKFHYEHIKQCIIADKNVICEKPMVETEEQALELMQLAREKNLLLLDALWTMYMPIIDSLQEKIKQIGKVQFSSASLGYPSIISKDNQIIKTQYDLWDYEVYPLATTLMLRGEPLAIKSKSKYVSDIQVKNTSILKYKRGIARIRASLMNRSSYVFLVLGSKGCIIARKWWFGNSPVIIWKYPFKFEVLKFNHVVNGYEYELDEVIECLDKHKIESEKYFWDKTLQTLKWAKEIRG